MSRALSSLTSKATLLASVALIVIGTASYLAITDRIDGPTYFGLALLVAGALFKTAPAKE